MRYTCLLAERPFSGDYVMSLFKMSLHNSAHILDVADILVCILGIGKLVNINILNTVFLHIQLLLLTWL